MRFSPVRFVLSLLALAIGLLFLAVSVRDAGAQATDEAEAEEIDEVVVHGATTLLGMRNQVRVAEDRFYEMFNELNSTLRAYPDQILSAFARRYLFLSEKIREEHAEWLEQLNESLQEAGATKAKARVTDAYYEHHVVANDRARKRAKREEEGAKEEGGLDEGSSDVNI